MRTGLVSVTFRHKTVAEICDLCVRAGLRYIEWGGDIHVIDLCSAQKAKRVSRDSGLEILAYGSYFRVGEPRAELERRVNIAKEMECDTIRIWCGDRGSREVDPIQRGDIVEELLRCCELARRYDAVLALEFHGGTLTDSVASVRALLSETRAAANLKFLWQPRWDWREDERLAALTAIGERLSHIHAFTWRHDGDNITRLPLADGAACWRRALSLTAVPALLEFVADENAFFDDACALDTLCRECYGNGK